MNIMGTRLLPARSHGYYDTNGHWQRTKCCFVYCGDRCTCKPPNGIYTLKNKIKTEAEESSNENRNNI